MDFVQSRRGGHHGFTLVELLVVFAIAALVIGLAPVAFDRLRDATQYRATVRAVLGDLRRAHAEATSQGRPVRFQMDMSRREYGLQGGARKALPPALSVRATVGGTELAGGDVASILFLPDGGATGGTLDLVRSTGAGTRIRVDWMTGQVDHQPL
ncbi:GspH/FimT family pseudopilin [Paracidovorax sp. MALMAid1276]|uniref:GspH/FimT family pseudopilin n=1 Tax=Paracidovorax sp. MALMAid1276 TaxID=3411631 RepID=UPI003B9CB493